MPIQEHVNDTFEVLTKYFNAIIKPNVKINFGRIGYSQSINSNLLKGYVQMPNSFIPYKETDYYYKGVNEKFIHFTFLNTFFHIINNAYFLASQFSNHDDPLELMYAGKELLSVSTNDDLNNLKELIFSLSICIYEKDTDSFDMWRLYGDNGYEIN